MIILVWSPLSIHLFAFSTSMFPWSPILPLLFFSLHLFPPLLYYVSSLRKGFRFKFIIFTSLQFTADGVFPGNATGTMFLPLIQLFLLPPCLSSFIHSPPPYSLSFCIELWMWSLNSRHGWGRCQDMYGFTATALETIILKRLKNRLHFSGL